MLQGEKTKIWQNLVLLFFQHLIGYVAYFFLIGSVIFSLTILLFVLLNLKPDFSFSLLKYFAFINPIFKERSFTMGIKEIMQIYVVVSLILLAIVGLTKLIANRIFNFNINISISLKRKLIISLIFITAVYIIAFLIVTFNNSLDKGFYGVLIIFYFVNLLSVLFYILLNALYNLLGKKND